MAMIAWAFGDLANFGLTERARYGWLPPAKNAGGKVLGALARSLAPFPSPQILQNGPRRQGSAAPRTNRAPLTAPGRSDKPVPS
jgi:hypothetical protein